MKVIDFHSLSLAAQLDHLRAATLRLTMKSTLLRRIYCDRSYRIGLNFISLTAIYLAISLQYSVVLLILGPLILGYPHLIASYRFLQRPISGVGLRWDTKTVFRLFILLTSCSLFIRFILPSFLNLPTLPYATWEILLSLSVLAFFKMKFNMISHFSIVALTLLFTAGVLGLAWHDPLAFVGLALIFHNWVAFGHWFFAAKDFKNRSVVLSAVFLFAVIHALVMKGFFDAWISFPAIEFISARSFEVNGWVLAPWTSDPMIWNRIIVLYAFGLSMHYFIWLRAIPQFLDPRSVPSSFRNSFRQLRQDCGPKTTQVLLLAGTVVGLAMWFETALAGRIYFGIAMLHGWLEFVFLTIALSAFLVRAAYRVF